MYTEPENVWWLSHRLLHVVVSVRAGYSPFAIWVRASIPYCCVSQTRNPLFRRSDSLNMLIYRSTINLLQTIYVEDTAGEVLSYLCKGGRGVDVGWGPFRSPSGCASSIVERNVDVGTLAV